MTIKKIFIIGMLVALFAGSMGIFATAADTDLAQQYAPILYFEQNEKCFPVDVSYALDNSELYLLGTSTPILTNPNATAIATYILPLYYLDNNKGTVNDNGIIDDYQSKMSTLGYTVYAHVVSSDTTTTIQYWFFYAFNAGDLNQHEGDWEMIQVVLSNGQPTEAMYSQHYSGQKATWNQVDHEGDRIKDYVARGSHANYFRSYSGKIGLASDAVGSNGNILQPTDYTIELLDTQAWLQFAGNWGWIGGDLGQAIESSILGAAGPQGPMYRENGNMWDAQTWGTGLPQANDTFFLLEWLLYNFVMIFSVATLATVLVLCYLIYRRKKKYGLGPRILSMLYIDGLNKKSIGNILFIAGIIVAIIGLVAPWYAVHINIAIPSYKTTGLVDLLAIDGVKGLQVTLPGASGPIPLGSFILPFSFVIGIGLFLTILGSVGVPQSKKLGRKYIWRGIKLFFPFIIIFAVVMAVGLIVPILSPVDIKGNTGVTAAINAFSSAPFGGKTTVMLTDVNGQVHLDWGFGIGLYLLLIAGIILIVAGIFESMAKATFFEQKQVELSKKEKKQQQKKT
ncbi:MAG: Vps62-related protein [Euryarchaeota archaeon]|nr:Vps62-related protein [Euryarchaeota archaeon]